MNMQSSVDWNEIYRLIRFIYSHIGNKQIHNFILIHEIDEFQCRCGVET